MAYGRQLVLSILTSDGSRRLPKIPGKQRGVMPSSVAKRRKSTPS